MGCLSLMGKARVASGKMLRPPFQYSSIIYYCNFIGAKAFHQAFLQGPDTLGGHSGNPFHELIAQFVILPALFTHFAQTDCR